LQFQQPQNPAKGVQMAQFSGASFVAIVHHTACSHFFHLENV